MFVFKFIAPYVTNFQNIKANHGIALFMMSKKAYIDLNKMSKDMQYKSNIFGFHKYFEDFTKSENYKNLLDQIKTDVEMIQAQCVCYSCDIEMCSKEISGEFDLEKVSSPNFDKLLNETVEQYWFLLAESLGSVKGTQK